jgi:hypothetical protein
MPYSKVRLPTFAKDECHVEQGGVIEGMKTFKPSENSRVRACIKFLADVPAFTKFRHDGTLYEKLRDGKVRRIQRGRPVRLDMNLALQVIVFA